MAGVLGASPVLPVRPAQEPRSALAHYRTSSGGESYDAGTRMYTNRMRAPTGSFLLRASRGGSDLPAPERSPGNKRLNLCATCIVPGEAAEDATTDVSVPAGGRARRRRCPSSHVSRRRESVREPVWA